MSGCTIEITGEAQYLPASDGSLTIRVPIRIRRLGGRKEIQHPAGAHHGRVTPLQSALARGHRWQAVLDSGKVKTLKELAERENVDPSYVTRMVNLTLLAPDIVEAILDDTLPDHVTLFDLAVDMPSLWDEQRQRIYTLK